MNRGRGNRGGRQTRADLPYNREGRIAPYARNDRRRPGGDDERKKFRK